VALLKDFFELGNHGTDARREVLAGATTFVSAMYIVLVNPAILQAAGMPYSASLTATVLVSAFSSILMGLYTNNPLLVAPGMSLNSLFALAVAKSEGVDYATALGCVFWAGVLFLLLMVIDKKRRVIAGMPRMLRLGMAGGIGLFIAILGLRSGGLIVPHQEHGLTLGAFTPYSISFLVGLAITSVLVVRKAAAGFLWGVVITTLLAWPIGRLWAEQLPPAVVWSGWFQAPDFSLLLALDISGAVNLAHWPLIFVILFSCMFDSMATIAGVAEAGDLVDHHGRPLGLDKGLPACAWATVAAGLVGTSPAVAFVESSTGVRAGGRTGLSAVVAGLLFLPLLFFSPLLSLVPALATAPILVLAGIFMLKPLIYVRWERLDDAVPFFMTMMLMPLTQSITQGIIWGCLSWVVLKAASGKYRQISAPLLLLSAMALALLFDLVYIGH
jgi:AGZA family xanthine/uracil permease-like MFS transporter